MLRPRATAHATDCDWHLDQYDWECTCGAVENPDQFKPQWLKAADSQMSGTTSEEE